jgi:hypothetical protein
MWLALFAVVNVAAYSKPEAVAYANKWWKSTNHNCSSAYTSCTPYSYWGGESCGESSHGGDCANFVSQSLVAGGHAHLTKSPCRGYPCGKEEIGAGNLGECLAKNYGWKSTCGKDLKPPTDIEIGDVLILRKASCSDSEAHATIVTKKVGSSVYISCHSNDRNNFDYTGFAGEFGYMQWLHFPTLEEGTALDKLQNSKPDTKKISMSQ